MNLAKMMTDFQDKTTKTQESFTKELRYNLGTIDTGNLQSIVNQEVKKTIDKNRQMMSELETAHNQYKKREKWLVRTFGSMLLVFMLFALIMTIGSDFMSFIHVDDLQSIIGGKIKASEGWIVILWYVLYFVPYMLVIGLYLWLFKWIGDKVLNMY